MTMTLAWICAGLIAGTPTADPTPPVDPVAAYQDARSKVGRSPEDQIRLALWCEAHGLTAQRLHHLTLAILADPGNATARGLMGMVSVGGRWLRPEAVAERVNADPGRLANLAEYEDRRQKSAYTAEAQWALADWADEHGLMEQARAHYTAVTRLDPSREMAWKKLGYRKHEGRWVTDSLLAKEKAEAEVQKGADRKWKVLLARYKAMLDQPSRREEAEAALSALTDPRAVPAILRAFVGARPDEQLRAVQLLGQVESPAASRALAGLAVLSKSAEVRRAALETLKPRDPRDFVRLWIAMIRKTVKYEVKPVGGPGSPGTLLVEGQKANLRRVYVAPAVPRFPILPGASLSYDANGLPVLTESLGMVSITGITAGSGSGFTPNLGNVGRGLAEARPSGRGQAAVEKQTKAEHPAAPSVDAGRYVFTENGTFPLVVEGRTGPGFVVGNLRQEQEIQIPIGRMELEARRSAMSAQDRLKSDVAALDEANAATRLSNEPALQALRTITGKDFGDDPTAWARWWTDRQGYAFAITQSNDVPTFTQEVSPDYVPSAVPQIIGGAVLGTTHHSCFAAGTTVRTIAGDRAIELIRAGDVVLVQDTRTGGLAYQGVVVAYHNPPSPTLKVRLGEDTAIVATGIHRFWKVGQGWTMARELKVGNLVRTLEGVVQVSAVGEDRVQSVFNLEVAEGHSFLVGRAGVLVHDNSLVEATPDPFDAPPKAEASK